MQLGDIRIPRGVLVAALLLFFMPFITVSCGSQHVSLSGVQMMSGGGMFGESQPPQFDIILSFLAGLIALGSTWLRFKLVQPVTAIFAASAFGWLQFFRLRIDASMTQTGGLITLSYDFAFWLANLAFLATAALSAWLFLQSRQGISTLVATPQMAIGTLGGAVADDSVLSAPTAPNLSATNTHDEQRL